MITVRLTAVAIVASMALRAYAQPGGDDFRQTKEWKALGRYVGTWDNQVTDTVPEFKQSRRTPTFAWILGDRFLQLKEKAADGTEGMFLFAHDPNRQAIRAWLFDPNRRGRGAVGAER